MGEGLTREEVERLTKIREMALSRVKELRGELERWETIVKLAEGALTRFRRAVEIPVPAARVPGAPPKPIKYKAVEPIKTQLGEKLADMSVAEDFVRIVPVEGFSFKVDDPAFRAFFLRRVMSRMEETDRESVRKGLLRAGQALSYDVRQDETGRIKEITIRNPRDRVKEIRSAIEWTLRRMYERLQR